MTHSIDLWLNCRRINKSAQVCIGHKFTTAIFAIFWATVCRNVSPYDGTVVLSACLSVTLVYCSQTAGWIKMSLGTEIGDIVRWRSSSPKERGKAAPNVSSHFLLARSPSSSTAEQLLSSCNYLHNFGRPFAKKVRSSLYATGSLSCLIPVCISVCRSVCNVGELWPNDWMDRSRCHLGQSPKVGLDPGNIVLDGDPALLPRNGHSSSLHMPIVTITVGWI